MRSHLRLYGWFLILVQLQKKNDNIPFLKKTKEKIKEKKNRNSLNVSLI